MKKERKWLCGILAAVILGNMTGCAEQISGKTTVNRILAEESYINVILGEGYHQQEVRFDLKNDRAVIPERCAVGECTVIETEFRSEFPTERAKGVRSMIQIRK